MTAENPPALDLISTSQKTPSKRASRCAYNAPYVAVIKDGNGVLTQGCCNHWDCPRCRFTIAAYHKHRMIEGAKILMETGPLYFWTTTCIGKELDLETADDDYLLWTNRLLSTCRARAKKQGSRWEYVQVTERQSRGAAHSHYIHTFLPDDASLITSAKRNKAGELVDYEHEFSPWFVLSNVRAGLGVQCLITDVKSEVGVASYISGYLEKQLSTDVWPKHWKRIRYSRGWPDAATPPDWARALNSRADWDQADKQGVMFVAEDETMYQMAKHHMAMVARSEAK